jgi:type I restriction enzyme S subunit
MLEHLISKATWTRVAFGDVVRLSKARVADPEAAGIERVVGLEHIEPGDLRVRRWGDVADGTTFTTLFKPGQVLFGKRRAYQRKVAVADFEGVCSGDIYVLEPANDRLMLELLPFLCQTDAFFDHAVGTSAGSLSPRTNWTSLANFEFLLPPIQEQARLVEVMEASRSAMEANSKLLLRLRDLRASLILAVTGGNEFGASDSGSVQMVRLGDVSNVVRGSTPRPAGDRRYFGGDHIPWITVGEITKDDGVFLDATETCLTELGQTFSRVVPAGTVVLSNSGWTLGVPKILAITGCANDGVAAFLDLDRKIDPMFLYFRLFGMTEYLRNVIAAGGDQPNLNTDRISKLTIPMLTRPEQEKAIGQVNAVQAEIDKVKLRQSAQAGLNRRLAESAFLRED